MDQKMSMVHRTAGSPREASLSELFNRLELCYPFLLLSLQGGDGNDPQGMNGEESGSFRDRDLKGDRRLTLKGDSESLGSYKKASRRKLKRYGDISSNDTQDTSN